MKIAQLIANRNAADIITITENVPLAQAVGVLAEKRIGAVPVMRGGECVGIFSERDLIYRMAQEGTSCLNHTVGEVMTAPPISVEADSLVDNALGLMTRRRIRHLPVMQNGVMCGFISIGDLVKTRIDEVQEEAEAMRAYIQTA